MSNADALRELASALKHDEHPVAAVTWHHEYGPLIGCMIVVEHVDDAWELHPDEDYAAGPAAIYAHEVRGLKQEDEMVIIPLVRLESFALVDGPLLTVSELESLGVRPR
jgi:hypothetical protein